MRKSALFGSVFIVAAICGMSFGQTLTIYQDDFSGSGALLNGAAPDTRPGTETWVANNFVSDNGTIIGSNEGGALLPFDPIPNVTYTLSMDVLMPVGVDRWIALGFAQDPIPNAGANDLQGRFANEVEGISWMLFRDHSDTAQEVQIFKGRRTQTSIADTNPTLTFGTLHTLSIVLDTTGDGTSFTANFLIDGPSISSGPQTISTLDNPGGGATVPGVLLDQIRYAGFAFDNSTVNPPTVDNFALTMVPEPASLALLAFGGLFLARRRA